MLCRDESVSYLNQYGYSVIKMPRENVEPLLVLSGNRADLTPLGPFSDLVANNVTPPITRDIVASSITGKRTSKLECTIGLDLVNRFLTALGALTAKVSEKYQEAKQLQIVFEG